MDNKIKLRVLGLTSSHLQSNAYALILADLDSNIRIPVIIGPAEAQAIAIVLENVKPPRPMTHDLFYSFIHAFGIKLDHVFINRFEDGIFTSELTFSDGERTVVLDARTSDAIALALRTKVPIYTTREVLEETGIELRTTADTSLSTETEEEYTRHVPPIENYTVEELERTLAKLIENEEYEEAAKVQAILNRKRNNDK